MKKVLSLLFGILLLGCTSTNSMENHENAENQNVTITQKVVELTPQFDFEKFKIQNGQLGDIKIGMTITEAEMQFTGLTKKIDDAFNFGFDGGSPAYLYYSGDELIFGLIPKLQTDTLLYIIAAHKNLQTTNGLNPNSTVEELLKKYPDLTVQQSLMNSWEFFQDPTNQWEFTFMTDEETIIGEYPVLEAPSKPKRLTTRTTWITIK